MKKTLSLLLIILSANGSLAQNSEQLSPFQKVIYTLENIQVAPEFPGGTKKFDEYVRANFRNPKAKSGIEIVVEFVVEMDGSIKNVEILKDDKVGSGKELKRIMENSPMWLQGEHEGYHVRTKLKYALTI